MPDWPNHLTPEERARLGQIDQERAALKQERDQLMNRAKLRKHRQRCIFARLLPRSVRLKGRAASVCREGGQDRWKGETSARNAKGDQTEA